MFKRSIEILLMVLIAFAVIVASLQVFTRFVVQKPLPWTEEAARFSFIWISFLGTFIGYTKTSHFNIDFLLNATKGISNKVLNCICDLVVFGFSLLVVKFGIDLVNMTLLQRSPILGVPMGWVYSILPISFFLIAIHALVRISHHIRKSGEKEVMG